MNRRTALSLPVAGGLLAACTGSRVALGGPSPQTRWRVRWCEGLDAVAFCGPLTGQPFYADHYRAELSAFLPRLAPAVVPTLQGLAAESDAADTLLWPWLALLLSGGPHDTLDDVLASVEEAERSLRPAYEGGPHWDAPAWARFIGMRPRLRQVLRGLQEAGFAAFWRDGHTAQANRRLHELRSLLEGLDVVSEQERLLGRTLPREIDVTLLQFCRPHGVRVHGQHFLAHVLSSDDALVLTAAHEILHPPFAMDGPAARGCLALLQEDALLKRILAEKSRDSGYNSLVGLFEEDVVQALDQIVQERLGRGRAASDRWRRADQGMHVLAAALYGMLKADGYDRRGGVIESWLADAALQGRLASPRWQASASAVLGLPADRLWTTPAPATTFLSRAAMTA
jgi:hypothetical protein